MSVGVMEDYKLRDLRASHTLVRVEKTFSHTHTHTPDPTAAPTSCRVCVVQRE
jgi:hypothetical protein